MQQIHTEVLVIGGGATGTGILRDLAMRGFHTVLVERRDLTHGTTGRYHGLLHSGGRYVVKDPQAARECIEENRILRRIMPQCIEDAGGFFVLTPWDAPEYASLFLTGCQQAGIPVDEIQIAQMLREEPLLNPHITRCFRVPDGAADSFLAADLTAASAQHYGAHCLTYHQVEQLLVKKEGENTRVIGAICTDLVHNQEVCIYADLVINASGAWAGKIAATANIQVQILPGKGTMLALNHRVVHTVINRCKMPADGDILVPAHTVAVIGTTDIKVSDPDHFGIEPWEIRLMLAEGEKIIPAFNHFRILRAWAGVRPLYQETAATQNRDVTRAFVLLDHAQRDQVEGFLTITSGKWTTYRKMAEVTVDKACQKLNVQRPCRTHLEELPSPGGNTVHGFHNLGERLRNIESTKEYGQLICECEMATRADVERAITIGNAQTLDDIRRDTRLGMGPCQGAFCTYRASGLLHELRRLSPELTNAAICDFLQERWKGMQSVLWGQQLRQVRLNELIYLDVLNLDHLPGPHSTHLAPEPYTPASHNRSNDFSRYPESTQDFDPAPDLTSGTSVSIPTPSSAAFTPQLDVLVIGAGLSGLTAGWQSSRLGRKTRVIAKGLGATHWGSGCIDILGYLPGKYEYPVVSPAESLPEVIANHPNHPYAMIGLEMIGQALTQFQALCQESGYPLLGSIERNWLLPTALGAIRPTCLAPQTMVAGDLHSRDPMLIVGFNHYQDFYASLVADNLEAQQVIARELTLDLPELSALHIVSTMTLARLFDTPEFRRKVAQSILPRLGSVKRVGFPAVLGLHRPIEAIHDLEQQLRVPVFEIPGLPPSIPGMRLHSLLVKAIQASGGQVYSGMQVLSSEVVDNQVASVISEAAARTKSHPAHHYILATGGFLGGGFTSVESGYAQETIFGLPIDAPPVRTDWFLPEYIPQGGQPIFKAGILVNHQFTPFGKQGQACLTNLSVVGSALGGFDPLRERSLEGVALTSGYWAASHIGEAHHE
jgi:glycerol-3-phosphate dehydrogenase